MHIKIIKSYHVITARNSHLKNQSTARKKQQQQQETSVDEDV